MWHIIHCQGNAISFESIGTYVIALIHFVLLLYKVLSTTNGLLLNLMHIAQKEY